MFSFRPTLLLPLFLLILAAGMGIAHAADNRAGAEEAAQLPQTLTFSAIENSANATICALVLDEAYKKLGIKLRPEFYPAERALRSANDGDVDGEMCRVAAVAADYPNLLNVPVPVNRQYAVVVTKNVQFPVHGWDSLKPYRIGLRRGIKFAMIRTKGMNVVVADDNESLLKLLDLGQIDIVVMTNLVALQAIDNAHIPGIRMLNPPIDVEPQYHFLNVKNRYLIPSISRVLRDMEKTGRINAIRSAFIKSHFGAEAQLVR